MPLYSVRLGSGAAQPRVEELTLATGGRIGALRRALKDSADLVFVDPPHVVDMPTSDASRFDSDAAATPTSDADTPRAWWFAESREDGQYRKFVKFEETLRYLRNILEKEGPFDGIFGFSQGAACGAILTALVEQPSLDPIFAAPSENPDVQWPPAPFKFAVLSAGFYPLDPRANACFNGDTKPKTPTLHVLGRVRPVLRFQSLLGEDVVLTSVLTHPQGDTIVGEGASLVFLGLVARSVLTAPHAHRAISPAHAGFRGRACRVA